MGIWFVILIVAEIALFLLYVYFLKKYPVLYMPFDYQYRVFKRAYRAYHVAFRNLNLKFYNEFMDYLYYKEQI